MADPLSQDDPNNVLSFGPNAAMLAPQSATEPAAPPPPPDPTRERINQLMGRADQNIDTAIGAMDEQTRIAEQKSTALAPIRQRMAQMNSAPLPELPQPKESPPVPQRQNRHDDETWLFAASLLGAIGGAFTRNHITNALGAFQGAMEGYAQGSRQAFDEKMKVWEAENKKVLQTNQAALNRYKEVLENRRLSQDQMSVELQLAAAEFDDKAMATAAKSKNSIVIAQLYDKQAETLQKLDKSSQALIAQHAEAKQREWEKMAEQYANSPAGLARAKAIAELRLPPVPTNSRTGFEGARNAALMAKVLEFNPNYDAYAAGAHKIEMEIPARVDAQRAMIPGRVEQAGQSAAARTIETRLTVMDNVARKLASVVPDALAASDAVPRGKWVPVNEAIQMVQRGSSDVRLEAFAAQNVNLAEQWARALKPTGVLDVALQQKAMETLSTAKSPEAYKTLVGQIVRDIERERQATQDQRDHKPLTIPEVPGAYYPPGQLPLGGGGGGAAPAPASDPAGLR